MCRKSANGGYISLAATLTSKKVMQCVEANGNVLMHGPTFLANPLERIQNIQTQLNEELTIVKEVRTLGAIGVVELNKEVDLDFMTPEFIRERV